MHAVRAVLRHNDAVAVVATHSPVVVQETMGRHIAVVRRFGAETRIAAPRIETYGESIGELTNEIFRSEEHTSELQSLMRISYAVLCLKKKKRNNKQSHIKQVDRNIENKTRNSMTQDRIK